MQRSKQAAALAIALMLSASPAAAAVMLEVQMPAAPCHLDALACQPIIGAGGTAETMMSEPALAAIVGLVVLGLAFGRRRPSLPQVVS